MNAFPVTQRRSAHMTTTLERNQGPGEIMKKERQEEKQNSNIPHLSSQADLHMETYKTEQASTTENTHN